MTALAAFTLFHVALSLVGIAAGFVVLFGLLHGRRLDGWMAVFLTTTVATSVTGFGFPADHILPSHVLAVLSLAVLGVAIYARYRAHLAGRWRATYVTTATVAQYFNVFVLVVQSFQKVPALRALAPTQSELPFAVTQVVVLVGMIALGSLAAFRFDARGGRALRAV